VLCLAAGEVCRGILRPESN